MDVILDKMRSKGQGYD